ncbi:ParH-like protein [Streptomyces sp. NPDC093225]|uniref:ParH-like protein n=1 Tax=Streptomyces sp. NPDC093225 TaxID=3366034 RepID=UPI003813D5A9
MLSRVPRRGLWRRCRRIADGVPLPEPFALEPLAAALSERLGRPVEFLALPAGAFGTCGVLVSTDRADYIGYPSDTTALHQRHIVLHEVGHLLGGHRQTGPVADTTTVRALVPHLSDELVHRVLGRGAYTDAQEQEAELIASMVMHRAAAGRPAAGTPYPTAQTERLGGVFDVPARRPDVAAGGRDVPPGGSDDSPGGSDVPGRPVAVPSVRPDLPAVRPGVPARGRRGTVGP